MTYEAYDVVVVPFPFTERPAIRRRPALVLSKAGFNRTHEHLVLAMITSAGGTVWRSDVALSDLAAAGLGSPSVVRLKLFTLDQTLVATRIGALGEVDRSAVAETFAHNVG